MKIPGSVTSVGSGSGLESVFDTLSDQLGLEHHRGRTCDGAYGKVAAKLLALAAAIWHNWLTDTPDKRSLTAYDH